MRSAHRLFAAAVFLLISFLATSRMHADNLFAYLHFSTEAGEVSIDTKPVEVDIDGTIEAKWQREQLLVAIADRGAPAPATSALTTRINALSAAVSGFLATQQALVAANAAQVKLSAAKREDDETTDVEAKKVTAARVVQARTDQRVAVSEWSKAGLAAIKDVEPFKVSDPPVYDAVNENILTDYDAVARALRKFLSQAGDDLAKVLASQGSVQITMTSRLVDSAGKSTQLHLEGYDNIAVGSPVPFARFQLALDQRAKAEFDAAKNLAPIVSKAMSGEAGLKLNASLKQFADTLKTVPALLKNSELKTDIDKLVADLATDVRSQLSPLKEKARQIRDVVSSLSDLGDLPTSPTPDELPAIANKILGTASRLQTVLDLQGWADTLPNLIPEALRASETQLRTDVAAVANTLKTALTAPVLTFVQGLRDQLQDVSKALGLTGQLAESANDLSTRAKVVDVGVSFDTQLDLTTIAGERHPGDLVYIQTAVRRSDPGGEKTETIFEGRKTFRLEKYGWYAETRGALLFVQPRNPVRNISFQPVPAVGYYWHYGRKDKPGWNHELAPAIGFSLTLLDFDDQHDFELGLGAGATLFRDIFSVGGGRNLQAAKWYYYVGLNPLAVVGLVRR